MQFPLENFYAAPKVVKTQKKFRQDDVKENNESALKFYNMMWDKRVIRGNTYATVVTDKPIEPSPKKNFKKLPKVETTELNEVEQQTQPGTPRPLPGREHAGVETDEFVETLTDKPPHYTKEVQTEFNIEKSPPRHYLPVKTGISKETQIWDGEIFDFDYEVEPILQVLLGKTIEQSRMEVLQEQELFVMKEQQKHYENLKRLEMEETQRLEEKEKNLIKEIENRRTQAKKKKEINIKSHKKVLCREISKDFFGEIGLITVRKMESIGLFRSKLEENMLSEFLPWILDKTKSNLLLKKDIFSNLKSFIQDIQLDAQKENESRIHIYKEEMIRRRNEEERIRLEKEEQKRIRMENRKRKAELKRRANLKNEIQEKFFTKTEVKNGFLTQILSDIDGSEKETSFVGLFGGLLGELLILMHTLEEIAREEIFKIFSMNFNAKMIKIMINCINMVLSSTTADFILNEEILTEIVKIDENLTLEAMNNGTLESDKVKILKPLVLNNIASIIVNSFIHYADQLELNKEISNICVRTFLEHVFDNENGKNLKFIKATSKNFFQKKMAICRIKPNIEELNLREDFQDKKSESRKPEALFEAELEEKFTVLSSVSEDNRILILHTVAQECLRREWFNELKSEFSELAGYENLLLKRIWNKAQKLEKMIIELNQEGKLDEFDFEIY